MPGRATALDLDFGLAAAEVRYARRDGLLVGRHRLPDDDAEGRPRWDDLGHFETAAL